jgi:cyanophycinase
MIRFLLVLLISAVILSAPAPRRLVPIGGGYSDIYAGFSQTAVANAKNNQVNILVLAPTYSTNAFQITEGERTTNLRDAEERRFQIEAACKRAAPAPLICKATLAPIFTRADAENPAHLRLFSDDLAAVFILGGDQTVAMQVIMGTPVEKRLEELHENGVIVAGTSAGGAMQSRAMLAGYSLNYAAETSLFFGAADVWNSPEKHGLTFGLQTAILDQHFYQRARFGRLLNAILQPGIPHVGVGVDAYTGVIAQDEVLGDVFGLYTVTVLDAETYHAADGVSYIRLDEERPPLLSARNILVHILSPGDFSYDLKTRQASLAAPASQLNRTFESLILPPGAGPLILAGDLSGSLETSPVIAQFKEIGGENILVIATGYSSERSAQGTLEAYGHALGNSNLLYVSDQPLIIPPETTGIVVFGKDQSKVDPTALASLKDFWLSGKPVLADNAAAVLMGASYSAHGPTPKDAEEAELATQKCFRQGKTILQPGLRLLNITLEPQILADNRFGRWFSLAYHHPDLPAFGLNKDTAVEITSEGARARGENGIFVLDLQYARLALGSNDGFVLANGLLDIFAPGELLQPNPADVNMQFTPAATPVMPAMTPTFTFTPAVTATRPMQTIAFPTTKSISTLEPATREPITLLGVIVGLVLLIGAALAGILQRNRS